MKRCIMLLLAFAFMLAVSACTDGQKATDATVDPTGSQGKLLFRENCASCHALTPDTILVGPSLAGISTRAHNNPGGLEARAYLEKAIRSPKAEIVNGFPDVMPADFGEKLTEEQIAALLDFLLALE